MRLLADENIDGLVVRRLRDDGHDVESVAELAPSTVDPDVLRQATAADRILVTADKDFGELVYRLRQAHAGVVFLRLGGLSSEERAELVAGVVRERAAELPGAFTVVTSDVVRVRRPNPA